jgi:hypothetical protein
MRPTEKRSTSTEAKIRQQTVPATFASKATFLVAAERTGWVEFVVGVWPHHTGAELTYDFENLASPGESAGPFFRDNLIDAWRRPVRVIA